jgi:YegS/Rv2252/BmrU family lipid kinase
VARVLLIFNPVAARADLKVVDRVARVFSREGWEIDVEGTSRVGHAEDLARAGVDDGVDLVAVYGGDGTTMQAVAGMAGSEVPVALIPGGTGNLLAGNLRLPRNPKAAARAAARGVPRAIDLGLLHRADGDRYFAVACGAGFDAELMAATTGEAKRRWRFGAYVAQTLERVGDLKVVPHRVTVDGEVLETDAVMVLVANCGEIIPPFVKLRDGIQLDDGLFDVAIANASSLVEGIDLLWRMLTGNLDAEHRLRFLRGEEVTVETAEPRPVELDGEPGGTTPFTARILSHAIKVMVSRTREGGSRWATKPT